MPHCPFSICTVRWQHSGKAWMPGFLNGVVNAKGDWNSKSGRERVNSGSNNPMSGFLTETSCAVVT